MNRLALFYAIFLAVLAINAGITAERTRIFGANSTEHTPEENQLTRDLFTTVGPMVNRGEWKPVIDALGAEPWKRNGLSALIAIQAYEGLCDLKMAEVVAQAWSRNAGNARDVWYCFRLRHGLIDEVPEAKDLFLQFHRNQIANPKFASMAASWALLCAGQGREAVDNLRQLFENHQKGVDSEKHQPPTAIEYLQAFIIAEQAGFREAARQEYFQKAVTTAWTGGSAYTKFLRQSFLPAKDTLLASVDQPGPMLDIAKVNFGNTPYGARMNWNYFFGLYNLSQGHETAALENLHRLEQAIIHPNEKTPFLFPRPVGSFVGVMMMDQAAKQLSLDLKPYLRAHDNLECAYLYWINELRRLRAKHPDLARALFEKDKETAAKSTAKPETPAVTPPRSGPVDKPSATLEPGCDDF